MGVAGDRGAWAAEVRTAGERFQDEPYARGVAKDAESAGPGWAERLRGLADLLPMFVGGEDPEKAISALNEAAFRLGWVLPDFDWAKWACEPECQRLAREPSRIACADPITLARLLTSHLRQERLCEGHLRSAYEGGHLTAIVRRAAKLMAARDGASTRRSAVGEGAPLFGRFIGIDYSGAKTPTSGLAGLRVYMSEGGGPATEMRPSACRKRHWTRRGVAEWLVARLTEDEHTIVGIDHGFSFPITYFERHRLRRDWHAFLDDFRLHWPTDGDEVSVESVREGRVGRGAERMGDRKWKRVTEVRAGGAKSVFLFDVQGSVAKSTHAGLPWLRFLRERLPGRVHFWPFDGWTALPGRSVVAEVYPSLWSKAWPRVERTADQHDAWSVAEWLKRTDEEGRLGGYLNPGLGEEDRAVAALEGWILGVGARGRDGH